jgi:hypothetical protein
MPQILHPARSDGEGCHQRCRQEQELDLEDEQPANQDATTVEVINADDDLSDEGNGIADAGVITDIDS